MKGYANIGVVPVLGIEAEIMGWYDTPANYVVGKLVKKGNIPTTYASKNHNWHCSCETCRLIGSNAMVPVTWKRQNDATLPSGGAEFISSRFPAVQPLVNDAVNTMLTLGKDSYGIDLHHIDKYGRPAMPGMHVHASLPPSTSKMTLQSEMMGEELTRIMYLFYPELLRLSSASGRCRSLHYRWPKFDLNLHHNFMAICGNQYVEWRIWEGDFTNETYIRGAIWTSAALTRLMRTPRSLLMLESIGHKDRWDRGTIDQWIYSSDPHREAEQHGDGHPVDPRSDEFKEIALNTFDHERLEALRLVVLDHLVDSEDYDVVDSFFEMAHAGGVF